jgi:hypothetical protein
MQLIAIYSIFDGLELLEGSIRQTYSACFKVILHYQTTSNFGEVDEDVENFVWMLAEKYEKINLLRYEPILNNSGGTNEKKKRLLGIEYARTFGGSHFIFIDCDEYYITDEFIRASDFILENNYDSSACRLFTYYKDPIYRLIPLENYYVPFIHSISLTLTNEYSVYADPTRISKGQNFYEFKQDEIMMHHFSWVRKDLGKKLRNSSANINWRQKIPDMVKQYHNFQLGDQIIAYPGHAIRQVDNVFNIRI